MRQMVLMLGVLATSGCALMGGSKEPLKTDFDFGPPGVPSAAATRSLSVGIVVYDITAPAWMDHSAMYYRLTYRNASNPMPYANSEWVMSPAALLTQRVRSRLADAAAGDVRRVGTGTPAVYALRSELVEFEQIFDGPDRSRGVIRLRATLEGDGVWAQRTFAIEKPAPTSDAAGGVAALTQCADELALSINEWIAATPQIGGQAITQAQ